MIKHFRIMIAGLILTALLTGCDVFTKLDPIDFGQDDTASQLADITGAKVITKSITNSNKSASNGSIATDSSGYIYIPVKNSTKYIIRKFESNFILNSDSSDFTNNFSGLSVANSTDLYATNNNLIYKYESSLLTNNTEVSHSVTSPVKYVYLDADASYIYDNVNSIYRNSTAVSTSFLCGDMAVDYTNASNSNFYCSTSDDGKIYGLNNSGAVEITFNSSLDRSICIAAVNGYVYAAGYITVDSVNTGVIQKFKTDGTLVCTYMSGDFTPQISGIAVSTNGRIYISIFTAPENYKIYYFDQ